MRAEPLMEPAPCLLLLLFWGYCLAVIDGEGELRCYCNESGCVSTGYMCKSPAGHCYTSLHLQGDTTRATHGCVDSLPVEQRGLCDGTGSQARAAGGEGAARGGGGGGRRAGDEEGGEGGAGGGGEDGVPGFPLFLCCEQDMCNYMENMDFSNLATLTRTNGSLHRGTGGDDRGVIYSKNGAADDSDGGLWFKAAVIAVPIAGGFILVLLVLLAVRMLRSDSQRHRRLIQVRRERSLTKAQLYVTDHFSDVSVKSDGGPGCPLFQPRSRSYPSSHGAGGGGGDRGGGGKGVGLTVTGSCGRGHEGYSRDVNLSVEREGRVYQQVQCDVSTHRHPHRPAAMMNWGHVTSEDLASVV